MTISSKFTRCLLIAHFAAIASTIAVAVIGLTIAVVAILGAPGTAFGGERQAAKERSRVLNDTSFQVSTSDKRQLNKRSGGVTRGVRTLKTRPGTATRAKAIDRASSRFRRYTYNRLRW